MAKLIKCKHCKHQIARKAKSCPSCGGSNKKTSLLGYCIMFFMFMYVVSLFNSPEEDSKPQKVTKAKKANILKAKKQNAINKFLSASDCKPEDLKIAKYAAIGKDNVNIYKLSNGKYTKILNEAASKALKEKHYHTVNHKSKIFEACQKGDYSYIFPIGQESAKGWIKTNNIVGYNGLKKVQINPSIFEKYTKSNYRETLKKFGRYLNRIQSMRVQLAKKLISSNKCEYIEHSDLSLDKSSKRNLIFWATCGNKERYYLSEKEIKAETKLLSQSEKSWTEHDAKLACMQLVRSRVQNKSTLDFHMLGMGARKVASTQVVSVSLDFDAKNSFGVQQDFTAYCTFKPGKDGSIQIEQK